MIRPPNKNLLGRYHAANLTFNLGSDFHVIPRKNEVNRFIEEIKQLINTETLFLLGDICLSSPKYGIDTSDSTNEILYRLSSLASQILFVPGNHDLRREIPTNNPWKDFECPSNVNMPHGENPLTVSIQNTRILLANIGYEFDFVDPAIIGFTKKEVLDFYASHNDGKYLLQGKDSVDLFKKMAQKTREAIKPDIDIVATHPLPHPSLSIFKMPTMNKKIQQMRAAQGLTFIYDPEGNMAEALFRGTTIEQGIHNWNMHSTYLGSDIVNGTPFKSGITYAFGHNHRSTDLTKTIGGREVRLLSHQREFLPLEKA